MIPIFLSLLICLNILGISEAKENPGTVINVLKYGALGNGLTDDTAAIQAAINATPPNGILFFPTPRVYYKITSPLLLKSNLKITGNSSKIYMPSYPNDRTTTIFYTNKSSTTSNVDISGLKLQSTNDVSGVGFYAHSNTSNVMGFDFENTSHVDIHDLSIDSALYGIKLSVRSNDHVFINDVKISNTATDIYMSHASDIHISNSHLDSSGFLLTDHHLHNIYIEGAVSNVFIRDVSFANTAGGGIQIYQESGFPSSNINITNASFNNCHTALIAWSKVKGVKVTGFTASSTPTILSINDAHGVTLSYGKIKLYRKLLLNDTKTSTDIRFDHLTID